MAQRKAKTEQYRAQKSKDRKIKQHLDAVVAKSGEIIGPSLLKKSKSPNLVSLRRFNMEKKSVEEESNTDSDRDSDKSESTEKNMRQKRVTIIDRLEIKDDQTQNSKVEEKPQLKSVTVDSEDLVEAESSGEESVEEFKDNDEDLVLEKASKLTGQAK